MAKCNCPGATCSCLIVPGRATKVSGTGTKDNPFKIDVDPTGLSFGSVIATQNTASVELTKQGSGAENDPIILSARVIVRSPDQKKWTLQVTNAGALSAVQVA